MNRQEAEIDWIFNNQISGEQQADGVKVRDAEGHECLITFHNEPGSNHGIIRFDGRYVDVGDDFPVLLGILDEVAEDGMSKPDPDDEEGGHGVLFVMISWPDDPERGQEHFGPFESEEAQMTWIDKCQDAALLGWKLLQGAQYLATRLDEPFDPDSLMLDAMEWGSS